MAGEATSAYDPRVPLLLLLSGTTGLVDAVSVLGLGKVFTANMTGNIVFLGFAVAQTPGFVIAPYLVALATFFLGALAAGAAGRRLVGGSVRRWLMTAAFIEAILLWAAAATATRFDPQAMAPDWALYLIIALTAVGMGYRNATIRQLKVPDLTTTVLTLTIAGVAADSRLAGGGAPNLSRRLGSVLAIFAGAAIGAVLVIRTGLVLPLVLAGAIVLAGTLAWAQHPSATLPHKG
ncbi:YoaK family protein [Polymorphobacter fuscus]|uniref:DUF1275 domain-containing protein n=1 Tax=Sandarakinorhabdus fusca TaxID=1439888 RepID=A0A7C9KJX0_9SPHN|nr:YoaK family protein [Polymorphobacter fuscus]KAB7648557.1 DUF1275 domain-containing protein [Polymorphobacter fuscus]MQT16103.1 DUF1275 domain-containing protein [Polymorphobacter fuscus]NJC07618.1 uncharacterized membrane protein YoaK (UPF0700 family) [Polymorphobacter fuscus]